MEPQRMGRKPGGFGLIVALALTDQVAYLVVYRERSRPFINVLLILTPGFCVSGRSGKFFFQNSDRIVPFEA